MLNEEECTIAKTVIAVVGADLEGAFRSPSEWDDDYGQDSQLILIHDGGALAPYCSLDYEDYDLVEELVVALANIGYYSEQCTSWYSAVYKS